MKALHAAHDKLSNLLEDPEGENDDIRDAAIDICTTLIDTYPKIEGLQSALQDLLDWGRKHSGPCDENSPHDLLVAAHNALEKAGVKL